MNRRTASLLGLGPVFEYEWLIGSRRWQTYALRSAFVFFLLMAVILTWRSHTFAGDETSIQALAALGQSFYHGLILTQLALVLLVAPAATAGSICIDRARGTMTHLLVTDLTDPEIVLGKLAARLVPVFGLVACSLPVMSILTLIGGIDPIALAGGYAVTVGVAILGCCIATVCSLWMGKTHEALLATYVIWGVWLLGAPIVEYVWVGFAGTSLGFMNYWFNPFWMIANGATGDPLVGLLVNTVFLVITLFVSAILALVAVWRLRPVCCRDTVKKPLRHSTRMTLLYRWFDQIGRRTGPWLDYNPVYWRECHRGRGSRWARLMCGLFMVGSIVFGGIVVWNGGSSEMNVLFNAFHIAIGLLWLSVTSGTSLAEERVRGSLDVLMATTLSTREIVLGKWLGAYRMVPWLALLPTAVLIGTCDWDYRTWLAVPLLIGGVLTIGAALTSVGLALATTISRLGRAVAMSVGLYMAVTVGWLFAIVAFQPRSDGVGPVMGSPFMYFAFVTAYACRNGPAAREFIVGWAIFWMIISSGVALGFLSFTLKSFNRCLGRVEFGAPMWTRYVTMMQKPGAIEEIAGETIYIT